MKIAILGFGDQGKTALNYWSQSSNQITVCDIDKNIQLPGSVAGNLGENYLNNLKEYDLIIRSPSVHPRDIVALNSKAILTKVTTITNEFFKVCPTKNIIGVTGTKGKGTTSTLIAKMLEASGKKVHLGGNIGTPPLDLLNQKIGSQDWVVLELANFQLIDLKYSPRLAICLMVVPEHLDWHSNVEEYYQAKEQLFAHQNKDDAAIYFAGNEESRKIANAGNGKKIPYFTAPGAIVQNSIVSIEGQEICQVSDIKLLGRHNWQNICAAVTCVWQIDKNVEAMKSVLSTFGGLEHRLEFVRDLENIKYYDDSFATTPEAAAVAIEAFTQPKIVILGGSEKRATYNDLANVVKTNNVRKTVIIGATGPDIERALRQVGFNEIVNGGNNIIEIVNSARKEAKSGDVILLSTGCASFDMFKNYKDRGEQFKAAVRGLV